MIVSSYSNIIFYGLFFAEYMNSPWTTSLILPEIGGHQTHNKTCKFNVIFLSLKLMII